VVDLARDDLGPDYAHYLRELIRFGVLNPALEPLFLRYFKPADISWARGSYGPAWLDESLGTRGRLSTGDIVLIEAGRVDAFDLAQYLERKAPAFRIDAVPEIVGAEPSVAEAPAESAASTTPAAAPAPPREFVATAHEFDPQAAAGERARAEVERPQPDTGYVLRLGVSRAGRKNLAIGEVEVGEVPPGGLATRWFVKSHAVDFVPALSSCRVERKGRFWVASFDLHVPEKGDSRFEELGIRTGATLGEVQVSIYAAQPGTERLDLYRELTVDLAAPDQLQDETCTALPHTLLRTSHEWTTPMVHAQVQFWRDSVHITMLRGAAIKDYGDSFDWSVNAAHLANP
ncbi:MAG: hypothetical protein Q7T55_17195, partial [Solirubrobacteraceae bacterium]|nr:hypothetical protein [Solirubrobacteraceae bacterium]